MRARIWEEVVVIPTYTTGEPNANPMFFENRVYQGSSGRVYPYPIIESVGDTKEDRPYTAVFLENDYLKVMVLPQLGGRIHRIIDKSTGEDAVYYNEVIKPALVGLLGPWISGGIEFNWPQHHRPTTFMPVSYLINEYAADGKVSVQLGDTDRMYGSKSVATISLYDHKAYVEITGQLFNPTQFSQTFLWWANPAIAVNDYTQSIFPPDVHAVMDHGKRDVSSFPIATGIYYKHDYSEGVDISRYKNIPVPTSYMAYHSDYDFVGSYDHQKQTGILHVADHHISPGKKQWTWGCGDFGKAWDRNLTDENGPYIELMTGVFTDNQPDFSFLEPGEEKTFTQYFFPYKHAPRIINATKDVLLSLDEQSNLSLYVTSPADLRLVVASSTGQYLINKPLTLKSAEYYETKLKSNKKPYTISVLTVEGETLLLFNDTGHRGTSHTPRAGKSHPRTQVHRNLRRVVLGSCPSPTVSPCHIQKRTVLRGSLEARSKRLPLQHSLWRVVAKAGLVRTKRDLFLDCHRACNQAQSQPGRWQGLHPAWSLLVPSTAIPRGLRCFLQGDLGREAAGAGLSPSWYAGNQKAALSRSRELPAAGFDKEQQQPNGSQLPCSYET